MNVSLFEIGDYFLKFLHLFAYCMCRSAYVNVRDPPYGRRLSFNPVNARNELRLSGLAVGTLMRCLTSP